MDPDREQQLRDLIAKWESKVLELSGTDAVGAADAEIKLYDAKADLARLQGRHEAERKAEMAKAKAEMAKAKAEMAKAKAEMAAAVGGTDAHNMANKANGRAESEYEAAKKVHDALLEQVTGGGNGAHPTIVVLSSPVVVASLSVSVPMRRVAKASACPFVETDIVVLFTFCFPTSNGAVSIMTALNLGVIDCAVFIDCDLQNKRPLIRLS